MLTRITNTFINLLYNLHFSDLRFVTLRIVGEHHLENFGHKSRFYNFPCLSPPDCVLRRESKDSRNPHAFQPARSAEAFPACLRVFHITRIIFRLPRLFRRVSPAVRLRLRVPTFSSKRLLLRVLLRKDRTVRAK